MTISARISVLGLGRLGSCLARALHAADVTQIAVASRERATAEQFASSIGGGVQAVDASEIADTADLVFLAVPDSQVHVISGTLPLTAAHSVVHLSGVLGLDCLDAAAMRGARVGGFHPLQAFPRDAGSDRFVGIYAGIEASDAALVGQLEGIARVLGATPFSLAGVDRAAYHAAAVFASNYVVALHAAAAQVWARAGLPAASARAALAPLTSGATEAIASHELTRALTGPVARGDVASVDRHLQVLQGDPALFELYRGLLRELLRLPLGLSDEVHAALVAKLQAGPTE